MGRSAKRRKQIKDRKNSLVSQNLTAIQTKICQLEGGKEKSIQNISLNKYNDGEWIEGDWKQKKEMIDKLIENKNQSIRDEKENTKPKNTNPPVIKTVLKSILELADKKRDLESKAESMATINDTLQNISNILQRQIFRNILLQMGLKDLLPYLIKHNNRQLNDEVMKFENQRKVENNIELTKAGKHPLNVFSEAYVSLLDVQDARDDLISMIENISKGLLTPNEIKKSYAYLSKQSKDIAVQTEVISDEPCYIESNNVDNNDSDKENGSLIPEQKHSLLVLKRKNKSLQDTKTNLLQIDSDAIDSLEEKETNKIKSELSCQLCQRCSKSFCDKEVQTEKVVEDKQLLPLSPSLLAGFLSNIMSNMTTHQNLSKNENNLVESIKCYLDKNSEISQLFYTKNVTSQLPETKISPPLPAAKPIPPPAPPLNRKINGPPLPPPLSGVTSLNPIHCSNSRSSVVYSKTKITNTIQWKAVNNQVIINNKTIWNHFVEPDFPQDQREKLENMFERTNIVPKKVVSKTIVSTKTSPNKNEKNGKNRTGRLNEKRTLNLGIVLAKFKGIKGYDLVDALEKAQSSTFDIDIIQNLLTQYPTEKELESFNKIESREGLDNNESFVWGVARKPNLRLKLELMVFEANTTNDIQCFMKFGENCLLVCKKIMRNESVDQFFFKCLQFGNFLNQSTYTAGAQGFELRSLLSTLETKGTGAKNSLKMVDLLAEIADEVVLQVLDILPLLRNNKTFVLSAFNESVNELNSQISKITTRVKEAKIADELKNEYTELLNKYQSQYEKIKNIVTEIKNYELELQQFYCADKLKLEEILSIFLQAFTLFEAAKKILISKTIRIEKASKLGNNKPLHVIRKTITKTDLRKNVDIYNFIDMLNNSHI